MAVPHPATFRRARPARRGIASAAADRARPWWLWPHLLSLDAPLVAWVWQRWWARAARVELRPAQELALALGVWVIYLADRLADTRAGASAGHRTARHQFHREHRRALSAAAALAALALAAGSPACLGACEFRAGLGLLALAGGYFWLVHRPAPRRWAGVLPKEAAVGLFFAAGTGFFPACAARPAAAGWMWGLPGFAALCFLNCALITRWERSPGDRRDPSSLLNAFPGLTRRLGGWCAALALAALTASAAARTTVGLPVAASALLLALLDRRRGALSEPALRVLADAALLTPCAWLAGGG